MRRSKFLLILSLSLALVLVCAGACFASSSVPVIVPVSTSSNPDVALIQSEGFLFSYNSDNSLYDQYILAPSSNTADVSIAVVRFNSTEDFWLYARTTASSQLLYYTVYNGRNVYSQSFNPSYNFDSSSGYYYSMLSKSSSTTFSPDLPVYETVADFLGSPSDPIVITTNKITVPRGYALMVRSDADFVVEDVQLSVIDSFNFPKISSDSSLRTNDSRWGSILAERVTAGASADIGTLVRWFPLNSNVLGRASVYSCNTTHSYSLLPAEVFILTNPNYSGSYVQNESGEINQNIPMSVTIQTSGLGTIYYDLVPLSQELVVDDGVFHYANFFQPSGIISGTVTPGVDSGPGSVDFGTPSPGGADSDQPPLYDNTTLLGIVRGFVNSLVELFNKAVDSINVLVNQGSTFMTRLAELFTWLPAPVYAVIVAALVVAIVLGVIKLLF